MILCSTSNEEQLSSAGKTAAAAASTLQLPSFTTLQLPVFVTTNSAFRHWLVRLYSVLKMIQIRAIQDRSARFYISYPSDSARVQGINTVYEIVVCSRKVKSQKYIINRESTHPVSYFIDNSWHLFLMGNRISYIMVLMSHHFLDFLDRCCQACWHALPVAPRAHSQHISGSLFGGEINEIQGFRVRDSHLIYSVSTMLRQAGKLTLWLISLFSVMKCWNLETGCNVSCILCTLGSSKQNV